MDLGSSSRFGFMHRVAGTWGFRSSLVKGVEVSPTLSFQAPSDYLQRDDSHFTLALLDVRYVSAVHVQGDSHVDLSPALALPKQPDALPNLDQRT